MRVTSEPGVRMRVKSMRWGPWGAVCLALVGAVLSGRAQQPEIHHGRPDQSRPVPTPDLAEPVVKLLDAEARATRPGAERASLLREKGRILEEHQADRANAQ